MNRSRHKPETNLTKMGRKNTKNIKRNSGGSAAEAPWKIPFALGLALGSFITYFALPYIPSMQRMVDIADDAVTSVKNEKLQELKFTFYDDLKTAEIEVSDSQVETNQIKKPSYFLQAGSFQSIDDAENQRIELLLLNLDSKIEAVTNSSGERWHRVLVGPLESKAKVATSRAKLSQNQIDSFLLERSM